MWRTGFLKIEIDIADTKNSWISGKTIMIPTKQIPGMTFAKQRYYQRLNASLEGLLSTEGVIIAQKTRKRAPWRRQVLSTQSDYVNVGQVANVRVLPLGTDNFGRDVLTELVKATGVSLQIGLVAGYRCNLDRLDPGIAGGVYRRPGG